MARCNLVLTVHVRKLAVWALFKIGMALIRLRLPADTVVNMLRPLLSQCIRVEKRT